MTAPRAGWREATEWIEQTVNDLVGSMKPVPKMIPDPLDLDTLLLEVEVKRLQETLGGLAESSEVNPIASYGGDAIVKSPKIRRISSVFSFQGTRPPPGGFFFILPPRELPRADRIFRFFPRKSGNLPDMSVICSKRRGFARYPVFSSFSIRSSTVHFSARASL